MSGRFTLHSVYVNSAWHSGISESPYTVMFYTDPRVGVNMFSQSDMCSASQQEQDVRDKIT